MTIYSATGKELIDGRPFFREVDGVRMNRRQWLDATKEDRKAAFVAELRGFAEVVEPADDVDDLEDSEDDDE